MLKRDTANSVRHSECDTGWYERTVGGLEGRDGKAAKKADVLVGWRNSLLVTAQH